MKEKIQKKLGGLKLNVKFTIVIVLLVMVPISIFSGVLFYSIEDNTIRENTTYMQYTMERSRDNIRKNIDSVNMTTQFFLNDEPLLKVLNSTMGQERMTTEEMLEFYHSDISSLERLVNNNTLLCGWCFHPMNIGYCYCMEKGKKPYIVRTDSNCNYCEYCGKKIDWSNEE